MGDAYWIENQIQLHIHFALVHQINETCVIKGKELPFELFLYAEQGEFIIFWKEKSPIICRPGDVVFVPSDMAFQLKTDGKCGLGCIGVDYRLFSCIRLFSFFELPTFIEKVRKLCQTIVQTVRANDFTNSRLENAIVINTTLYRLALTVLKESSSHFQRDKMECMEKLSPVFSYICKNLEKTIWIEKLAGLIGTSEDALYRLFKDALGMSPKEYIIYERLRQARLMLLGSALPIGKISRLCGYESPFSFSSLFHERYGCSPSLYRTQMTALLS